GPAKPTAPDRSAWGPADASRVTGVRRRVRSLLFAATSLAAFLTLASSALAADGVGLWGATDDKVVTYWGFGGIVLFVVLVTVLSLIQIRLESRKGRLRQELGRLRPAAAE